jgi:hypothetical protein
MGRRARIALAVAIVATACVAPAATASVPNIDWTALLPALPSPTTPQPGPVPHCRVSSIRCIDTEVKRLRGAQRRFGCDHRAVFATTYLTLTRVFRGMIRSDPHLYEHPHYLYTEDALFADVYFRTLHRWRHGEAVDPAWRIAFDTAASGNANAAQDMLLGINAHVQNDMPFVVAALGLRTPSGESRKPDHDAVNAVLNRAYQPVVDAITRRYDPFVGTTNSDATPLDDIAGLELVRGWREVVWREAERLVNAKTAAQRQTIADQIHAYAGGWARAIAGANLNLPPGYRAQRDAYCEAHLRG